MSVSLNLQQRKAYALVREYPGATSFELARAGDLLDRYQVARRLEELEAAGCIVRGRPKTCAILQRSAATWRLPGVTRPARL